MTVADVIERGIRLAMAINSQKQVVKQFVEYWTFNRPGHAKLTNEHRTTKR